MLEKQQRLRTLARQVGKGDEPGTVRFRAELEPRVRRIVRCVLRGRFTDSPLAARIRLEAKRVLSARPGDWQHDPEGVVALVASQLCTAVIEQLRGEPDQAPDICETIFDGW